LTQTQQIPILYVFHGLIQSGTKHTIFCIQGRLLHQIGWPLYQIGRLLHQIG